MHLRLLFVALALGLQEIHGHPAVVHYDRIVGGVVTNITDHPWQVSLRNIILGLSHFCGGSILNENWILTAAHCLDGLGDIQYDIVAGQQNIHIPDDYEEIRFVDQTIPHPNYTYSSKSFDIGLVKLTKPLVFNERIQPVELNGESIPPGTMCTATGWGTTEEDGLFLSSNLRKVDVPIVDDLTCQASYPKDMEESMICAGEPGKDTCAADSGGPLVCPTSVGPRLVGVTSYGIGCGRPNYPGVSTEVSYYLDWIAEVMENN